MCRLCSEMSTNRSATRAGRSRTTESKSDRRQRDSVTTSKQKEDGALEAKISQVVQLTGCTKDEAFVALYDCDNDAERAVDMLLESDDQGTWVKSTKKKRPPKLPASVETKTSADDAGRSEEATTSVSVGSRAASGAERGRSRTRGPGRGRPSEDGAWKARERRENEKNTWVGRGSGRGGRGGRRGGPMSRVFRQRGGAGGTGGADHSDDWCSGSLDAWNSASSGPSWTTDVDAGQSWNCPADNSTEDWNGVDKETPLVDEADEWCGPLTETKVFTPSGADSALLLNCSSELPALTSSVIDTTAVDNTGAALEAGEATLESAQTSALQQTHPTNLSEFPVSSDLSERMPVVLTTPSTINQSAATSKLRTKKTRTHGSVKIPESAVEMPADSVVNLGVNFGVALNFNAAVDSSDSVGSPTLPAAPVASLPSASNTPAATAEPFPSQQQPQQQQQHLAGSGGQSLLASSAGASTPPGSIYSSKVGVSLGSTRIAALSSGQAVAPGFSSSVCPPSVHPSSGSSPANGSVLSQTSSAFVDVSSAPPVSSSSSSGANLSVSGNGAGGAFSTQPVVTSAGTSYQLTPDAASSGSGAYGSAASQSAPGFGGYVNGGPTSGSTGQSTSGSAYLSSAGVSIKDKLASALAGGGHAVKQNHLDPMSTVSGSATAPSAGSNSHGSSGATASAAAATTTGASNGSIAHKLSGTRAGAAGLPGLPPGVPMQYFMGQAGVPAFYPGMQQIYGYEDLHALQQRMPHLATSVEQSVRVDTSSLSTTVAAGGYSDVGKFNRQDNSSPVHSSLSQQSHTQQQQQQQQFFNPAAIPPNYYYPYLSPYGIYAPLPQATNTVPPHQATTQYQKLSNPAGSYNSPGYGAYDSLVSSATGAPSDYKSPFVAAATGGSSAGAGASSSGSGSVAGSAGVSLGSTSTHKSTSATGSGSSGSDVYGKLPQLGKSFDNKGFHAATPPPFGLSGGAGGQGAPLAAAAGSAYAPHHMYLQPMAPQHPSQLLGHHHGHHPGHHQQDGSVGGHGPQQRQAPVAPVAAAGAKSAKPTGYSTGYWSSN